MVTDNRYSTSIVDGRLNGYGSNLSRWVRGYRNLQQATNSGGTATVKWRLKSAFT